MNHSPAEVLRSSLVNGQLGVLFSKAASGDWPIFVGHLPATPDNAICVYDTDGLLDGRIQATGETILHPGWQIRVVGKSHTDVYSKISAIRSFLDDIYKEDVSLDENAYIIEAATQTSGPVSLGQETDGKRRSGFTVNGMMTITIT